MSKKEFIRLNVNDKYLSLGNFFRIIKEESYNSNRFLQSDLFSIIFDTDEIADSTVNNYCTGLRSINSKYKNYYNELKNNFEKNKNILVITIAKIIDLIENEPIDIENISIKNINSNLKLKHICNRLYSISKNDSEVTIPFTKALYSYLENDNLYEFIAQILFFIVLEKKQPIYITDNLNEIIEKNIYNTNISINDIQEFINIQLNSSIWSIRGIKELAKKDNPFACFELASMEFYGIITGKPRYDEAYKYYKISANHNHPVANWAIGYLYYEGYIGKRNKHELYLAFKHFNKSRKLKCSNAFNSIGIMFLKGDVPHIKRNKEKAIDMFKQSVALGNIYAYNNLGKIYENEKQYKKAFEYYIVSANLGESWSANKVGEYYRKGIIENINYKKAFEYYTLSSECSKFTLCAWSKYNLAKYFYKDGNIDAEIKQDLNKAIILLEETSDELIEALEELIYIYYKLYINSHKQEKYYLDRLLYFKQKCESHWNYNINIKNRIEKELLEFNNDIEKIQIPE